MSLVKDSNEENPKAQTDNGLQCCELVSKLDIFLLMLLSSISFFGIFSAWGDVTKNSTRSFWYFFDLPKLVIDLWIEDYFDLEDLVNLEMLY